MPADAFSSSAPVRLLPRQTVEELSHEIGTPLTVILTSLNLLADRLARAHGGALDVLPLAMDLNADAMAATDTLVDVLQRIRAGQRAPNVPGESISTKDVALTVMGDRRFERHWAGWRSAVADGTTAAYLAETPLRDLVELLASSQAGGDARARNVLATAIANRVARLAAERGVAPSVIWARLAQTNDRIRTSRDLVARSRALADTSRWTAAHDGRSTEA